MRTLLLIATAIASLIATAQLGQEHRFLYPAFGSGVAIHDMDGDGDGDVIRIVNNELWLIEQTAPNIYRTTRDLGIVGDTPNIHFADVDGDGIQDAVFGTNKWIRILGGGNYIAPQTLVPGLIGSIDIRMADVDGDLDLDAICSYTSGTANIGWAENLGGGIFGPSQLITSGGNTYTTFDVADIDQDGDPDFAVTQPTLKWFENAGGGSFISHAIDPGTDFYEIHLADVNGDLAPDILVTNDYSGVGYAYIYRFTNTGGNTFVAGAPIATSSMQGFTEVRLIDRDGDGDLDLYYGLGINIQVPSSVVSLVNNGLGNFAGVGSYLSSNGITPFDVGDLDGDTLADLVGWDSSGLYAIVSAGGGNIRLSSISGPTSIHASDMDNDGDMDVLMSAYQYSGAYPIGAAPLQVAYHTNNGNGNMAETPVQVRQSFQSTNFTLPCDVDGDGDMDVVAQLTTSWGVGIQVYVIKNMGGGQFDTTGTIGTIDIYNPFVGQVIPIIMRDMDQDGDPDAVISTGLPGNQVQVCKNDGNGNFDAGQFYTWPGFSSWMTLCDVNADGAPDIVWGNWSNGGTDSLFWNANNGMGVPGSSQFLGIAPNTVIPMDSPIILRSKDLDNDGLEDLMFFDGASFGMLRNMGGNAFSTGQAFSASSAVAFDIGDMDGDSLPDIVALRANHDIVMWRNLGGVTFGSPELLATAPLSTGSSGLTLANMNEDGYLDVVTCSSNGSAAWLENLFGSPFRASGLIWHDANANTDHDPGEGPLPFIEIGCDPLGSFPLSDTTGHYEIAVYPGDFTVTSFAPDAFWALTTDSAAYHLNISYLTPTSTNNDFGYVATVDTTIVQASIVPFIGYCNEWAAFSVNVTNLGTTRPSGHIAFTLDTALTFQNATPPPDSITGQTLHWNFDSLYYYSTFGIVIGLTGPDTASLGTLMHDTLTVDLSDSLGNITQSITTLWQDTVTCSWDPNSKSVDPPGVGQYGVVPITTDHLDYTIRFQNTGNATAANVVLRDPLDADLDPTSIVLLGRSHTPSDVRIEPGNELVFRFNGINLPDSGSDYLGSEGFVKFRMRVMPGLPSGTAITNNAGIYFDLNAPVITNSTLTTLVDCSLFTAQISWTQTDLLAASAGMHYQWFLNGDSIANSDQPFHFTTAIGDYTVAVTNLYGCTAMSDPYNVITLGVQDANTSHFAIVPNPSSSDVRFISSEVINASDVLEVIDLNGHILRTMNGNGSHEAIIPRGDLRAGIYVVRTLRNGIQKGASRLVFE